MGSDGQDSGLEEMQRLGDSGWRDGPVQRQYGGDENMYAEKGEV